MQSLVRLLIFLALVVIVGSLGSALFHLGRGDAGDSRRMARALTIRIIVSLALFALLLVAWYAGLITPHDVQPGPATR
jgi:hypothetical protein